MPKESKPQYIPSVSISIPKIEGRLKYPAGINRISEPVSSELTMVYPLQWGLIQTSETSQTLSYQL